MTIPYVTGTVSVTAGSAVVTGSGTAWATALIAGGLFGLDSSNGNPVPILSVDSNTQLTLAKPWRGTTAAGQGYWIVRDTAYLQQQTVNAQALSTYIQRLDNAALAALAGLTPAADQFPYFNGANTAVLTALKAKGRDIIAAVDTLGLLEKLGPVLGGFTPVPSEAGVGLADGDFNSITVPGVYTIAGTWTNGPSGAAGSGYTAMLWVIARKFNNRWVQGLLHGGFEYTRWSSDGVTWDPWIMTPALNGVNNFTSAANTFVGLTSSGSIFLDNGANYNSLALRRSGMEARLEAGATSINLGTIGAHPLTFRVNSTEKARFEEVNGDFLVGLTATPDPASGSTLGFAIRGNTGRAWRRSSGYNPFIQSRLASDGSVQDFYREHTLVGNIQVSATGTTYSTTSDYRRKNDVQPIVTFSLTPEQFDVLDNAELKIMGLRPVFHRWNDAPEKGVVTGFIAHEAQPIVPHAVTGEKDGMVDIGREIIPARDIEVEVEDEEGNYVIRTITIPEQINEGVRIDGLAEGAKFEKTGEIPVYQTMDYGLITADIVAALQCVIYKNMLQGEEIASLNAANADMASRLSAIEQHLGLPLSP